VSLARRVAVNTSALTLGRIAFALSGLVGTAVATRYLGPEVFGSLTLALVLVSIFAMIGDGGVYSAVSREITRAPERERALLANALGLGLAVAVVAALGALVASWALYPGADGALVRQGAAILVIQVLATALTGTAGAHLVAHQRLVPVAVASGAAALAFLVVLGLTLLLDWGFAGVAAAYATSATLVAAPIAVTWREHGVAIAADLAEWRQLARWAAPQGAIVIVSVLYFRIDSILLSFLGTDRDVAYYGLAYKVIEVLMFVPTYFMASLFAEFARGRRHSDELSGRAQAAFTLLQLAALPVLVVFTVFAAQVVRVVGGPEFAGAAAPLALLVAAMLPFYLGVLFSQALIAQGEPGRLLVLLLAVLAANVALNVLLVPSLGARGAALAVLLSEVAALAAAMVLFGRLARIPRPFRPGAATLAAAAALAVAVAVRLAGEAAGAPALTVLTAGVPLALAAYAGVLAALDAVPGEITDLLAPALRSTRARWASRRAPSR